MIGLNFAFGSPYPRWNELISYVQGIIIFLFPDSTKNGFKNYLLKRKIRCILTAKTPTLPQRESSWPLLVFWSVWATTSHYLITPFLFWSSGDQMFVLSESQWANSGFSEKIQLLEDKLTPKRTYGAILPIAWSGITWGGSLEDLIEPVEKKTSTGYEVTPKAWGIEFRIELKNWVRNL